MGLFKDKDLRMVGLGLVVSAFMVMIYDVSQLGFKILSEEDGQQKIADEKEIGFKAWATLISVGCGIALLIYFTRIKKTTEQQ